MKSRLLTFIVFFISFFAYSQKEDYVWRLGNVDGIDFNNSYADTFSVPNKLTPLDFTNTSICDSSGNLLFYTNGIVIFNRNGDTLLNGNNLNPSTYTSNHATGSGLTIAGADIIIKRPGYSSQYYLFHKTIDNDSANNPPYGYCNVLYLTVIDMTLDGGMGGVTNVKNYHLYGNDTLLAGNLAAVRHANGRDWWLITKKLLAPVFYKWLIEPDTIIGPIVQSNQPADSYPQEEGYGGACFSLQGDKYAIEYIDNKAFYLYDFDRCTGNLTYVFNTNFNDSSIWGCSCAFCASGRYLYASTLYFIYQFDLLSGNILASQTTVAICDGYMDGGLTTFFDEMKLAPDGKIYIATPDGCNVMHVIESPDSAGLSCNVKQHSLNMPDYPFAADVVSVPNIPNYRLGAMEGPCDTILNTVANLQKNNAGVSVYPNPNNGNFTISFKQAIGNGKVEVFNMLGERVGLTPGPSPKERGEEAVHLDVAAGVYLLKISNGERQWFEKVIVE